MARDLKLQFTYSTIAGGAGVQALTPQTPSGELTDSGALINLYIGAAGTSVAGAIVSATLNSVGFRNTKADTSTFANWVRGAEISSIANDPALWGNTAYDPMVLHSNMSWTVPSATLAILENGGFIAVQGAFDNGSGAADATTWAPISGNMPLTTPVATLTTAAMTANNTFATTAAHGLLPGDGIVLYTVTGIANAAAKRIYRVATVPAPNVFTVNDALGAALTGGSALSGTPGGAYVVYRVTGFNGLSKVINVPLVGSIRPYMRVVVSYSTSDLVAAASLQLGLNRTVLVTGRESSVTA